MNQTVITESDTLLFWLDFLFTIVAFIIAVFLRDFFLHADQQLDFYSHIFILPLLIVLIISLLSYFGGYKNPIQKNLTGYAASIIKTLIVSIGVILGLLFFLKIQYVSRFVILFFAILELVTLFVIRVIYSNNFKEQVKSGKKKLNILIIGSRSRAIELVNVLKEQVVWGVNVIGFVDPYPDMYNTNVLGIPILGSIENIHEILKKNVVDEVIIAIPRSLLQDAEQIVEACEEEGITLRFMADLFNVQVARISFLQVGDIPLLTMEPVARDPQQIFMKRMFDLFLVILSLPIIIPLFIFIAIIIKIDSQGPVFFVQERVGLNKRLFKMYKFRSMYKDAEDRLKDIEHLNEAEGPIFKIKNDPRITRVGSLLRKTSLDELPQLINVFLGEMSLVGPRPMSIRDVDLFDKGIQRKRFSVQPGITCLWQISGRSDLPFEKWLALDLEYINNWNFWMDIKILIQTIPAVVKSKGAV